MPCAASGESSRNGEPGSRSASTRSRTNILFCSAWRSRPDPPARDFASSSRKARTRDSIASARSRNSREEASIREPRISMSRAVRPRVRSRPEWPGPSSAHPLPDFLPDEIDEGLRGRSGQEDLADPERLHRGDVLGGNDPAGENEDVLAPLLLQELQDLREEHVVRARQDREADDVDVFLNRGGGDLLRGLAQARVDDLHPRVPQRPRDHLRAAVVSVETRFGDQDPDRALHLRASLTDGGGLGLRDRMRATTERLAESDAEDSRPAAPSLPPDLAREGVRRLRVVGGVSLVAHAFFLAVSRLVGDPAVPQSAANISLGAAITGMVVAVLVMRLAYSNRIGSRTILDLALVYWVLDALFISLSSHVSPLTMERAPQGWSGVAVWVVAFPLVIPNTRGKVILATFVAAAMDPLGLVIQVSAGLPAPDPRALVASFAPTVLAVPIAIVMSGIIFRISVEAMRARDLGSYRLVEPLGSGGMGEVWRAEHVMLARRAAIKLIRTAGDGAAPSRDVQKRF